MITARVRTRLEPRLQKSDACWDWRGAFDDGGDPIMIVAVRPACARWIAYAIYADPKLKETIAVLNTCGNQRCVAPHHSKPSVKEGRHPRAKLTSAEVIEIRKLFGAKMAKKAIARKFGVDPGTILAIIRGATWEHVTG